MGPGSVPNTERRQTRKPHVLVTQADSGPQHDPPPQACPTPVDGSPRPHAPNRARRRRPATLASGSSQPIHSLRLSPNRKHRIDRRTAPHRCDRARSMSRGSSEWLTDSQGVAEPAPPRDPWKSSGKWASMRPRQAAHRRTQRRAPSADRDDPGDHSVLQHHVQLAGGVTAEGDDLTEDPEVAGPVGGIGCRAVLVPE